MAKTFIKHCKRFSLFRFQFKIICISLTIKSSPQAAYHFENFAPNRLSSKYRIAQYKQTISQSGICSAMCVMPDPIRYMYIYMYVHMDGTTMDFVPKREERAASPVAIQLLLLFFLSNFCINNTQRRDMCGARSAAIKKSSREEKANRLRPSVAAH